MEIIRRIVDKHSKAFDKIEATGALDILHDQARQLREKGDPSAVVLRHRTFGSHLLIALHWGMIRCGSLQYPGWESKGVGMEATENSTPALRLTKGMSWSYLNFELPTSNADALEIRVQKAMQLATLQSDYRFGEKLSSWDPRQKLTRGYKILLPK